MFFLILTREPWCMVGYILRNGAVIKEGSNRERRSRKEGGIISFQKMALAVLLQYDTAEGDRHSCLGRSSLVDREKKRHC